MNTYSLVVVYKARYVGDKSRYAVRCDRPDGTHRLVTQGMKRPEAERALAHRAGDAA